MVTFNMVRKNLIVFSTADSSVRIMKGLSKYYEDAVGNTKTITFIIALYNIIL